MAVPDENLVRLSQTGTLLELELETIPTEFGQQLSGFTPSTLPALLTGAGDLGIATAITLNADGTVSLSNSPAEIPMTAGTAVVTGSLTTDHNQGGDVVILGDHIALIDAIVEASGTTDGGNILIGGDRLGDGSVPNATATVIDAASTVRADAEDIGEGGYIVTWGNDLLRMDGQLFARGGANGGNGGFIETSSLGILEVSTAPNVSAENGSGGLWLIDSA